MHKKTYSGIYLVFILSVVFVTGSQRLNSQETSPPESQEIGSVMEEKTKEQLNQLEHDVETLKQKVEQPPKDFWDKMGKVSTLISGILVALIGLYATQVYNRRQHVAEEARKERELAVLQVQTVEKFFPHLTSGDEAKKEAAIKAIAALGNGELATEIGRIFGGIGSKAALSKIASSPNMQVARSAEAALSELFSELRPSVVRIESGGRLVASGFFLSSSGLAVTTAHVASTLEAGKIQLKMASGETVLAVVQKVDRDRDLALLKAQTIQTVVPLSVTPAKVAPGSQVIALGQSAEAAWLAIVGTVAGETTLPQFGQDRIAVSLRSMPGFSGAPVLSAQGLLVGIVQAYSGSSGLTYLIPAELVNSAFAREINEWA